MKRTNINVVFIIFSLSFLALTPSLPTDGYVPALLFIKRYFHLNDTNMQFTLSIFVFITGFGQLVFGPLSDHYGRRVIAFFTIAFFFIASFLYMYAESYKEFLLLRFMQGLGAAGMSVLAPAIVRDLYSGEQISKVYGYLGAICSFSPIVAPLLGGYLAFHFGWQATGYIFLIPALLAGLSVYVLIPETLPQTRRVKLSWNILTTYKTILLNKFFSFYSLISAIGLAVAFIFSSVSAYILMDLLHFSTYLYSIYYSYYGVVYMLGNFTAGYIVEKIGIDRVVLYGLLMGIIGAIWMIVWNYYQPLSLLRFYVPMMLSIIGSTFCQIAGVGGAVKEFRVNTGAAVALNSAIRFIFISLVGILVVNKDIQSIFPIGIPILILNLLGIGLIFYFKRVLRHHLHNSRKKFFDFNL